METVVRSSVVEEGWKLKKGRGIDRLGDASCITDDEPRVRGVEKTGLLAFEQ